MYTYGCMRLAIEKRYSNHKYGSVRGFNKPSLSEFQPPATTFSAFNKASPFRLGWFSQGKRICSAVYWLPEYPEWLSTSCREDLHRFPQ